MSSEDLPRPARVVKLEQGSPEAEIAALRAENARLKANNTALGRENRRLKAYNAALHPVTTRLVADNTALRQDLAQRQAEIGLLRQDNARLQAEADALRVRAVQSDKRRARPRKVMAPRDWIEEWVMSGGDESKVVQQAAGSAAPVVKTDGA